MSCDVETYVGLPYKHLGRTREEGVDCYGLVRLVLQENCGITLPDYHYHPAMAQQRAVDFQLFDFYQCCDKVALYQRREYDIVWLRVPATADLILNHVGICAAGDTVIEAVSLTGSVLRPFSHVRDRVAGVYRINMEAFREQEENKKHLHDNLCP